jgi:hypothetical protein
MSDLPTIPVASPAGSPPPDESGGRSASPEPDLASWHPHSPVRRPEWRWIRATWLADSGRPNRRPSRRWDDEPVRRALSYLRRFGRSIDEGRLLDSDPAIWAACRLRRPEHAQLRAELEARVLARDDPSRSASRIGLTPSALETYIQLFFDVAERLRAVDYVRAFCIGREAFDGSGRASLGQIWKLLGYQGGPLVVDLAVEATAGLTRPDFAQPGVKTNPGLDEMRWLITLKRLPRDVRTILRLLRLERLRLDLERREFAMAPGGLATTARATSPCPLTGGLHGRRPQLVGRLSTVGAIPAVSVARLPERFAPSWPGFYAGAGAGHPSEGQKDPDQVQRAAS